MRRLGRRWGAALLALTIAGVARGERERDQIERRTPPVVVEAVRPADLPEDPSSFTTVIEPERYRGEQKTLDQLLDEAPGVQIRRFGGPGQPAEISIRGSTGSQVVILLDGVRLNSAQSGSVDLSTIPASLVERIEVSRGGGSVQTGSDAIGGVVNIITRRPDARPETSLAGAGGSFGTWEASATQTGRLDELELALGYDFFRTRGDFDFEPAQVILPDGTPVPDLVGSLERVNNETENHAGLLTIARDFGERVRLSLSDDFFYGSAGRPGPAAGAPQSRTAHQRRTRNVADFSLEAADLAGWGLDAELLAFHRYDRSRFRDPTPPQGAAVDSDNRNHALGGRGSLSRAFSLGPSRHEASLGGEVREDWLHAVEARDRARTVLGVFLQDEVGFFGDGLRLVPALRFDHTEGFGSEWLPRLGLVIAPRPWLRFKANGERSYRAPNFDELYFNEGSLRGNPALRPEQAWNVDGGVELGFQRLGPLDDLHLEAVGFHNAIENSIVFQLVSSSVVAATNTGGARATGAELAGGVALGWLGFDGHYTYLDTEKESNGEPLPGRPRHEYGLRLALSPPSGAFKLVGERVHTSEIPANFQGSSAIGARTVYHASLAVDLAKLGRLPEPLHLRARSLLLSVNGTNLTDQAVRDAQAFPQPGRSLMFRAEAAW